MGKNAPNYVAYREILLPLYVFDEVVEAAKQEKTARKIKSDEFDEQLTAEQAEKKELSDLAKFPLDTLSKYEGPRHRAFDIAQAEIESCSLEHLEADEHKRLRSLLKKLVKVGEYRKLQQISTNWRKQLDYLAEIFPNFVEVIDYLRECCAIAELTDSKVIRLETIAIQGEPGCGKSMFSEHVAQFLDAGVKRIKMETAQSNSVLSGSEAFWANSKPGAIFSIIALGTGAGDKHGYANATILLDEIDKVTTDDRFSPENALLSLLEKESAKNYADLCFSWLTLDASCLNFICTANDLTKVSEPLLSRMRVFEIDCLSQTQALEVAKSIATDILTDLEPEIYGYSFSDSAISALSKMTPRAMKQRARSAIGRVIYRNLGMTITENDFDVEPTKRQIGFI